MDIKTIKKKSKGFMISKGKIVFTCRVSRESLEVRDKAVMGMVLAHTFAAINIALSDEVC